MDDDDNNKHGGQFDASLQLPSSKADGKRADQDHAAELIRKKVQAAYGNEPDAQDEIKEVDDMGKNAHHSRHQQFIYELTSSGKSLQEVQAAWHEYYAGLSDTQKHQVWQEFYSSQAQTAHHPSVMHQKAPHQEQKPYQRPEPTPASVKKVRHQIEKHTISEKHVSRPKPVKSKKRANPIHSLLFGLGIGGITILIFLFSFFNERLIAPFIQPSRNVTNIPIIDAGSAVGTKPEVIIPKINVEIPVVYDVDTINEKVIEKGLENGVVHYADTAVPGQNGNVVIVGHSSNNILNPGKYKFAFTLLHDLQNGDTFYLQKDGKRYTYQVYKRTIVSPSDVSVLGLADKTASATLITCDPPGTSNNRLVITGEQISPDPSRNTASSGQNKLATSAAVVPGNSISLWSRITNWFTQ